MEKSRAEIELEKLKKDFVAQKDNVPNYSVDIKNRIGSDMDKHKKQAPVRTNETYLKQDDRTEKQRQISQKYAQSITDPSVSQQLIEGLQLPLRYTANPLKFAGDMASTFAPGSPMAKTLPNTIQDRQETRKVQLNPAIPVREKIDNLATETAGLTTNSLINAGTAELGYAVAPGATGSLSKLFASGSKANLLADLGQLAQTDFGKIADGDKAELINGLLNAVAPFSKLSNFDASTVVNNIKNWNTISNSDKIDTYKDIYNLSQSINQQTQRDERF